MLFELIRTLILFRLPRANLLEEIPLKTQHENDTGEDTTRKSSVSIACVVFINSTLPIVGIQASKSVPQNANQDVVTLIIL